MIKRLIILLVLTATAFATVTDTTIKRQFFACSGSTTVFRSTMPVNSSSDIRVEKRLISTGVPTELTEDINYTIVAAGGGYLNGSVVTISPALASTYSVVIIRDIILTQELVSGAVTHNTVENALDNIVRISQDNRNDIDQRALTIPESDPAGITVELPNSVDRASKVLSFDSAGNATASSAVPTGSVSFTTYGENVVEAENALAGKTVLNLAHVFDITDYDAVGDGTTDNQAFIQAAVDAAVAAGGGTVFVPAGDFMVKTTVVIPSVGGNIKLVGVGSATLEATTAEIPPSQLVTDQAIYILTIGETGTTYHNGPTIENLGFADTSSSNNQASGGIYNFQAAHVKILNCAFRNFTVGTAIYYDQDEQAVANFILDPMIRNCKYGIYTGKSIALRVYGGHIIGKDISSGIGVWAEYATATLTLNGVIFDDCVTGVLLGDSSNATSIAGNSHIIGCRFEGCTTNINLDQASMSNITQNFFHPTGTTTNILIGADTNNKNNQIYMNDYGDLDDAKITINFDVTGSSRNWIFEPGTQYFLTHRFVTTFTVGDTTPDVSAGFYWYSTVNTAATSITDFDGGKNYRGKKILVGIADVGGVGLTTFIHDTTKLHLSSGANYTPANREHLEFLYDGTRWVQIGGSPKTVTITVELTATNIKALNGTPIELVAAQGADTLVEFISAILIYDSTATAFDGVHTDEDLVIEYEDGDDVSQEIEVTGFLDQTNDEIRRVDSLATADPSTDDLYDNKNDALQLYMKTGEIATGTGTMTVKVTYRVHTLGL